MLRKAYGEFAPLYRRACTDEDAARQADFFEDIAVQMGYMLGGLLDSGHGRDADTDAAASLLMKFQQDDGSWTYTTAREPMQSSDFTTTAMAARVLRAYAPEEQKGRADEAIARARRWLLDNSPETTDDLAFRLLGLKWLGGEDDDIRGATAALRAVQREDGGWAQLPTSKSDAYATGMALFALNQGGGVAVTDPAYRRGVAFLLETQSGGRHVVRPEVGPRLQHVFRRRIPVREEPVHLAGGDLLGVDGPVPGGRAVARSGPVSRSARGGAPA